MWLLVDVYMQVQEELVRRSTGLLVAVGRKEGIGLKT